MKLPEFKLRVFHLGLILVGVPFLIELLLIGNLWMLVVRADKERVRENRNRQYSAMGTRLMALTYEAPYILLMSLQEHGDKLLHAYEKDVEEIRRLDKTARKMAENDPLVEDAAKDLEESLEVILSITETMAQAKRSGTAMGLFSEMPRLTSKFNNSKNLAIERIGIMTRIGQHTTQEAERRIAKVRELQSRILLLALAANLGIGLALFIFFKRRITQRLGVITSNTLLLTENKALAAPLSGHDEIAQLDKAFHSMDRQLKEASARERELFNNASDVICVLDGEHKFSRINPACQRLWSFSQDDLLGKSLFDLVAPSEHEALKNSLNLSRSSGGSADFELKLKRADQSLIDTLWSSYWSDSEGSLFCVVHDITERKQIERIKQRFLSIISFDLKMPLSSMSKSIANLLTAAETSLSKTAKDKLAVAQKNLDRLLGLVNDLLQVAEMEEGHLELQKETCNIDELLKRSVQDVEGIAQKLGIKIETKVQARDCYLDQNRIIQVLVNLLSNALKFSPLAATVTLEATVSDDTLLVSVIDRGRGVPASHKEAIFEKFKQVEAADGKRKSGTGLGLPICKQIIEEHFGEIGVDSKEGEGSRFYFTVPVDEEACKKAEQKRGQLPASRQESKANAPASPALITKQLPAKKQGGRLKLVHKGLVLVGIPIIFELAFVGALNYQLSQTDKYRQAELTQRKIATLSSRILQQYMKVALLITITKSKENWDAFNLAYQEMVKTREELRKVCSADPEVSKHLERVEEYNRKFDTFYKKASAEMVGGYTPGRHNLAFVSRTQMLPITAGVGRRLQRLMDDAEKREFNPREHAKQRSVQAGLLLAGLATNILVSLLLAVYFSKDITSRLATLADNAERLAKDVPLNHEFGGADEIANLDRVFHSTSNALQAARKKERAVFDNSQDLICAIDGAGHFVSSNQAAERLLGYQPSELLEKNILDITVEEDRETTRSSFLADHTENPAGSPRSQVEHESLENRLIRHDGSQIYILWSATKNPGQERIFCVAHDISSRKEFEQLKQEFLAMVSHDLRTPLTSISGIAKLIIAGAFGAPGESEMQNLQDITSESDKLLELINDLLDIEKLEAGKMQLVLQIVTLKELLERSVGNSLPGANISLPAVSDSVSIKADRDRIVQALSNVINHVVKRYQNGSAIQMNVEEGDNSIQINLQVAGKPLPATLRESLFDRFKEIPGNNQSSEDAGRGLALPIAKRIVEGHGGSIGVQVIEDLPANVFWMRLPKADNTQN